MKVSCECKARKAEVSCEKLRQATFILPCDETCKTKAVEREQSDEAKRKERAAAEEEQNRIEMEEFQRKYGTRKPKERKQRQMNVEEGRNWTKTISIAVALVIPIVGALGYYFLL